MGVDAMLFFKVKTGAAEPDFSFPGGYEAKPVASSYVPDGATHEVDTYSRYYGKGYERGHWPAICAVLLELHAHEDVERVWYGGDSSDEVEVCTPETVLELSRHYMDFGERPYRLYFQGVKSVPAKRHATANEPAEQIAARQ